jgi:alkanesulfonate monooxygenase SsuD/methylene tetrahydromethanopterin reductase-like flavin-dependent oxidoreductase (luciferase family)
MNLGVSIPLPAYLVDAGAMTRTAEALGFESFWCAEHPFIPVRTTSRFPGSEDGVIPEAYSHFVDPSVVLARASGTTSRIKLGTRIVLVPERHPLLLAKEVSTLGATRVIIRPATSTSEADMVAELSRIAETVMR